MKYSLIISTLLLFPVVLLVINYSSSQSKTRQSISLAEFPQADLVGESPAKDDFFERAVNAIRPSAEAGSGELLHCLIALSQIQGRTVWYSRKDYQELLARFLSYGSSSAPRFGITRHGARFYEHGVKNADGEPHPYQSLAVLAELGIPKERPLTLLDESVTIEDVVKDCEAMFDLEGEIEWSVVALILFDPHRRHIENRFGHRFSIDEIAQRLLKRKPGLGPCLGCHVLDALHVISKASKIGNRSIGSSTVAQIDKYLHCVSGFLNRTQQSDGSLSGDWGRLFFYSEDYRNYCLEYGIGYDPNSIRYPPMSSLIDWKVISTSHHLKWMLHHFDIETVDPEFLSRANIFLHDSLESLISDAESNNASQRERPAYCPMCHALHLLSVLNCQRDGTVGN